MSQITKQQLQSYLWESANILRGKIDSGDLSLHLMRLPNHLIDYVILHELVHTKVKNHSRDFWQLLDIVSGNAKKLDREVKEYSIEIY